MKKQRYAYCREEALEEQFADGLRELAIPPTTPTWLEVELVASCTERAAREREISRRQGAFGYLAGRQGLEPR